MMLKSSPLLGYHLRYSFTSLQTSFRNSNWWKHVQKSKPLDDVQSSTQTEYIDEARQKAVRAKVQNIDVNDYIGYSTRKVYYKHFYFEQPQLYNVSIKSKGIGANMRPTGKWDENSIVDEMTSKFEPLMRKAEISVEKMYQIELEQSKRDLDAFLRAKAEKRGKTYNF